MRSVVKVSAVVVVAVVVVVVIVVFVTVVVVEVVDVIVEVVVATVSRRGKPHTPNKTKGRVWTAWQSCEILETAAGQSRALYCGTRSLPFARAYYERDNYRWSTG